MVSKPSYKKRDESRGKSVSDYWPLFSLILIAALAGVALNWHAQGSFRDWMHYFMGFFLCCFAMFKIFNLSGFADGFQMYDIIAKDNRKYALVYPFIELTLGLGYLSFIFPVLVYLATIIIMLIGTIGVVKALLKGLDINCPCMGSVLSVPLSTVTLTEDIGMSVMAFIMMAMIF
ncbi:MAG: hypothetical protein KC713_10010 [Candidatus Omnitrophica bacterium]|nr:hypothetical protein [Candidatus Omnitrophota bacterium]